jgi:hypothetical protein
MSMRVIEPPDEIALQTMSRGDEGGSSMREGRQGDRQGTRWQVEASGRSKDREGKAGGLALSSDSRVVT